MATMVEVPLWLLLFVILLSAVAALDRILAPSVRWFFRRRMERAVAALNARLERPIEPFRLAQRQDMILRLAYDPKVTAAVAEYAEEVGIPPQVAFEQARDFAREIVPAFSATMYFGFAVQAARWLSRRLYRVRIGKVDAELAHIDRAATVVFVMNHRSNMDYVLVTWLIADRSAISYAVGEWARVWPLSRLIRGMGAYFIRRSSRNTLYRRVLARYVQMAAAEGVAQAIFPEGGLSLDGKVGAARLGLLSYIVGGFDPAGRDIVFVPVGLAYDRVLEDRVLTEAAAKGERRFRAPLGPILWFAIWRLGSILRGRFPGFGTAAAGFGAPVSLRAFIASQGSADVTEALGARLMADITRVVPVLPVPLVAAALSAVPLDRTALLAEMTRLVDLLRGAGAVLKLPPQGVERALDEGLTPLLHRGIVSADLRPRADSAAILAFYAASVWQALPEAGGNAATPQT
jgi:glycerol-3-phosphate O-acyltransferase